MPLPAFRRRLLQATSPAGPAGLGGANPFARATRRLMVTPWFAVAAGIVVATGVFMYSPHASLQFPVGKGGEQPCQPPECASTQQPSVRNSAPMLPAGGSVGRVLMNPPRKVTWRVIWQSQGRIFILIRISGKRLPKTWRLKFDMPGVVITGVQGARWQPAGSSAGTASWPAIGAPGQTAGPDGAGYQYGSARWYEPGRSFVVVGTGGQVSPTYCFFNKATCTFAFVAAAQRQSGSTELQSR